MMQLVDCLLLSERPLREGLRLRIPLEFHDDSDDVGHIATISPYHPPTLQGIDRPWEHAPVLRGPMPAFLEAGTALASMRLAQGDITSLSVQLSNEDAT